MDDDDDHDDSFAGFEGGEIGRRGQEVQSDANWVPSYAGEAGNEAEEDEEEEKEAADEVISSKRTIENGNGKREGKGKGRVDEVSDRENVAATSDEYEQLENVESDGDYEPSVDDSAGGEEAPDEGTSSQSARKWKRRRKSDDSDGESETFERFAEKYHKKNHFYPQDNNVDRKKECRTAGEAKSTGRKKRKFRKVRKAGIDKEHADAQWVKSLRGPHLRLMVALKELGTERVKTIKEDSLYNCLTPAALRAIGIIIEEHVKEQLSSLGCGPPGDGVETMQNGDSSFPNGVQSADIGHGVDGMDAKDGETHRTSTRKSRSSRGSKAVELVENVEEVNFMNDLQTERQGLGFRIDKHKEVEILNEESSSGASSEG